MALRLLGPQEAEIFDEVRDAMRIWMRTTLLAGAAAALLVLPAAAEERPALVAEGERLFKAQGCYGCHMVGKFGTPIGPDLSHVGAKYTKAYLARWVADPESVRPHAHMPKLELDPTEVAALAAWLSTLR